MTTTRTRVDREALILAGHDPLAFCINPTCRQPLPHVLADCEQPDCQQAWRDLLAAQEAVAAAIEAGVAEDRDRSADALASYDELARIKRNEDL